MTEAEWLASDDPQNMLAFLRSRASERKLRLFACTCCRRMWHLLTNRQSRWAAEVVERHADAAADVEDLRLAILGAENVAETLAASASSAEEEAQASAAFAVLNATSGGERAAEYSSSNISSAAFHTATAADAPSAADARSAERAGQAYLLRDIFGNPFRVVVVASRWLHWQDAAVVRLAQAAYESRILPAGTLDNTRLAVLADALEEAGCSDEQILGHLRSGGEHFRGCWVLDLLLGKS
jgi:hypothetical protein